MMKTRLAIIICALALAASGCSFVPSNGGNAEELQSRIEELEKENEDLKAQLASTGSGEGTSSAASSESEELSISLGETYTIEGLCDFCVNYADLKKEVLPPNPDSFYTYYPEEDGSTYMDVAISIKNTRTTSRTADEFGTVKVICGNGYEYDSFSTIEESGGTNFTYTNITSVDPLETATIHYIASIPNEIADDDSQSISLKITILDQEYSLNVR